MKKDVKFMVGAKRSQFDEKYDTKQDVFKSLKIKQVRSDVFKFIPFSVFIIIPGLELLLPPFLVIFPNSIPSQFMSEKAREEKFVKISERRDKAAMHLN